VPKQKFQRQISTPVIAEKPFPEYPFQPEPVPLYKDKTAKELEGLIPTAAMVGLPPHGSPVAKLDRYSGTDQSYQEVVSWTVERGVVGELREVSMLSDTYAKTRFRLTIGGRIYFRDKTIQAPLTLPFPDNRLPAQTEVLLECKSSDGSAITVDGSISGKELLA